MKGKNKTAIVTGGTRGIGRAIVNELAREGVNIAFNYLKSRDLAKEIEIELSSDEVKVKGYEVNIEDLQSVKKWVDDIKKDFDSIDILVNNAGIINDKALAFMEQEDWQKVIRVDLGGVFNITRSIIVDFLKRKSGVIVNISSVSGIRGIAKQTNYSAAKAAILGFTKALAQEVAPYNIRVNAVAPGFIKTDMLSSLNETMKDKELERIPLGRFGNPEEVAKVVKFLISDLADYITGQTFIVDGGLAT
ncbi:MAG: 3-oxoacyl-ACP reductase FabG [Candidatus Omnitrophica bacterium]|nr:3-oxoacyl-ACP reductase FabG [Candidatus Omnitrophota bacterium]